MPKKPPPEKPRDSMMDEVDALLKKLPGADPSLRSDPDAPPPAASSSPISSTPRPHRPITRSGPPPGPTRGDKAVTWSALGGGIVLGIALTQWPYASACGFPLLGYLAAVLTVIIVAGWVFIATWFHRMGFAHLLALVLGFWGIVLAAEQVLPRIGYAEEEATWRCVEEAEVAPPVLPAAVPVIADTLEDSLGAVADSADTPGDSATAIVDSADTARPEVPDSASLAQ